ncbi:MAG: hypothetical protein JWM60_1050 [Solirubrobacterales bacterium]|nr:hypothetical protein [Solirubrobacterales bacterium]
MKPAVQANTTAAKRYPSLVAFYNSDPDRLSSREQDVGLWWRESADGPLHRAAWINDTGELYLVRLGPPGDGGGTVEVLASVGDADRLARMLSGWRERCGEPGSLRWLRRRTALTATPMRRRPLRSHAPVGAAA